MELTHKITSTGRDFKPMVVTYAIIGGTALEDRYVFTYFLFEVNNGFEEAIASASPPIQRLVAHNGGIEPKPARLTRLNDENGNLVKVELRHPDYSPFNANAPLMFIQVQNLDEEMVDTIKVTIPIIKEDTNARPEQPPLASSSGSPARPENSGI